MDNRIEILADRLVNYSCQVQPKEKVLITGIGTDVNPLLRQVIREVYKAGGLPYVDLQDSTVTREILLSCTEEQLRFFAECELRRMEGMDAYIGIRGAGNAYELSDVPVDNLRLYSEMTNPALRYRVDHTKWVVLRYPNQAMA